MLWIVGKVFPELSRYLVSHNIAFGLLADSAIGARSIRAQRTVSANFSSQQSLLASLPADLSVSGLIVAGYEQYVLPAAWLAEHYGVPGMTSSSAQRVTDKILMHEAFHAADRGLCPDFTAVTSYDDLERFISKHPLPIMLKPSNLMKSLYVTRNDSLEELSANFKQLQRISKQRLAVASATRILAEEFIAGSMHTIAGFVDRKGNVSLIPTVADCVMARDLGFNDNFVAERRLPSILDESTQQQLLDVAAKGVEALQLTSCALHIELILTSKGPKIIEIAGRLGGYRPRMYANACGIDLYANLLATISDRPVDLSPRHHKFSAVLELFPSQTGQLREILGVEALESLPSVISIKSKYRMGDKVGKAADGYRACLIFILGSDSEAQLDSDISTIYAQARIEVIPATD